MKQVYFNQESTQRQYALQNKAQQLGWPQHAIKILDGDLGMSGSQSNQREDFKMLVADVSMAKVGAVFALEASRLSRSCTDWHRLLELCALTGTLIIDEDGCYNPSDFNDQLLLGLKGTMSQAELHFIRARLQGGKNNKAKKGELRFPLPVGFCYNDENKICLDYDEQIRNIVQLVFKIFKETGSAYGVVHYFRKEKFQFPKRAYGGIWKGKIIWGNLTHSRVLGILKNPSYAGTYVYGRYKYKKRLSNTGNLQITTVCLPIDEWNIVIQDHHDAYIRWEDYVTNQEILKNNRTNDNNVLPTTAREGLGLLQGLLICSYCGHRLIVRYKGNGGIYPTYECNWKKRDGLSNKSCLSVRGDSIDQAVTKKILDIITPVQIDIAVKAFEELEQRSQAINKQWLMKIERADYEAQLAQRRYEEVDPANRLVANTLEKKWNEALIILDDLQKQYSEYKEKNTLTTTIKEKHQIQELAKNFPSLWQSPSTSSKDRKRILRLLIKDITVEKINNLNKAILHIRWQGGATEDLETILPKKPQDKWRHPNVLIEQIRTLSLTMTDQQIVNKLNQEGIKTNKGNVFTVNSIEWIRFKHKIPAVKLTKPGELSIKEVAEKFQVSYYVVSYWLENDIVSARTVGRKKWILIDPDKELELRNRVENSTKIATARLKSQNQIEGGVL